MQNTPENDIISEMTRGPRWKILRAMDKPMTAAEVARKVDETPNNVTYHLHYLIKAGVVKEFIHPAHKARRIYQRQRVFAEVLIDHEEDDEVLTELSCIVTPVEAPEGMEAV